MGARSKARKRAVEMLYEADLRELDSEALLSGRVGSTDVPPVNEYTVTLVSGIAEHRRRIDELIVEHAQGWTLERMPIVDRAVLRLGFYELLWGVEVPPAVAIDEAVELAKALSTDDSPRFVNGVLGRFAGISEQRRDSLRGTESPGRDLEDRADSDELGVGDAGAEIRAGSDETGTYEAGTEDSDASGPGAATAETERQAPGQ